MKIFTRITKQFFYNLFNEESKLCKKVTNVMMTSFKFMLVIFAIGVVSQLMVGIIKHI